MHKRIPIFIGLTLVFIALWLLIIPNKSVNDVIDRLDTLGYDLQLRTRVNTSGVVKLSPVAIVDIDEKSLRAIGRWPWERGKLAELISKLQADGAAVIAFDIIFPEKERNIADVVAKELNERQLLTPDLGASLKKYSNYFAEDEEFVKSIHDVQPILSLGFTPRQEKTNVLPGPLFVLSKEESKQLDLVNPPGYVANIPVLQQAARYSGFINIFPDEDGIVRRAPLIVEYNNGIYPSLSLQAVMKFLGSDITLFTPQYDSQKKLEAIKLGNHTIPVDASGKALIPFVGKSFTFPYYSAVDVLQNLLPENALSGKIIFIGISAMGLGDLHPTAIQSPYPGVEIHATLTNGILQDDFSSVPEWTRGAEVIFTLIFGLIAAFCFPYLGPRMLGLLIVFVPLSIFLLNNWVWEEAGVVLSVLIPSFLVFILGFVNIIYGYLFETRKREHLKEMFGQYVPSRHIDEMLKTSGSYALKGESRELSVLFGDIRNFTTISEDMSANELVEMLNTFFTPMTEIIFKHKGTIDKYVGDLIMAFWGAPLKDKLHAHHAMSAALEMQKKIKFMQEDEKHPHWAAIKLGIGINSGLMNVGDMGSRYRRNYTVLGDAVNLASRIEELTKFYSVNILVTENTQMNSNRFVFRKLDKVRVKGKKNGIMIYELICAQLDATPELLNELEIWHKGLEAYFQQQWQEADKIISDLQKQFPHTKIYSIFLERIQAFKHQEPWPDWDGVYVHLNK